MTEGNAALLIQIFVALAMLMLGRRLFWLFVAGLGFVAGMSIAADYVQPSQEWVMLLVAFGFGLVGALLVVFVQKLAVVVAGFLAAAYLVQQLARDLGLGGDDLSLAMIVAGVVGAVVASLVFDWALILLSSFAGATLLVDAFDLEERMISLGLTIVAAIGGIAIQSQMLRHDKKEGG